MKSIVFEPKIWKDKNLSYGEWAVAHYLNLSGIYFDLLYTRDNNNHVEDFVIQILENQPSSKIPKDLLKKIEEIKYYLIYDGNYLDCNFRFRINTKNEIELFYGLINSTVAFIPYNEIIKLAKNLRIKTIKSSWQGEYSQIVDIAFLQSALIQKY